MQAGGERRLTIPANMAYGKKAQEKIPSNSTLIFGMFFIISIVMNAQALMSKLCRN